MRDPPDPQTSPRSPIAGFSGKDATPSLARSFALVVRRDLRLALRQGGDAAMVVAFFVLAVVLFPFGVGPEPAVLTRIASGIIWVTALLAALISLDRIFQADHEDGSLEALVLAPPPLELVVLAKVAAHWLASGLPLVLVSPLLGLLLGLDAAGYGALVLGMALGTPSLSLIGAVGAALSLGARRGGVLLSLLVLPLYIPVLILGAGAVEAAVAGLDPRPHLLILAAIMLTALPLAPLAAAAAVRQAVE
jgi:heme exporter protein B